MLGAIVTGKRTQIAVTVTVGVTILKVRLQEVQNNAVNGLTELLQYAVAAFATGTDRNRNTI